MVLPQGYKKAKPGEVCKLVKSLYGLKQASREWNFEFSHQLVSPGFLPSSNDPCLFIKGSGDTFICLLVYVDDVLVASASLHLIQHVKTFLHDKFIIKDLGDAHYILGMKIARGESGIALDQRKYVLDQVSSARLLGCK